MFKRLLWSSQKLSKKLFLKIEYHQILFTTRISIGHDVVLLNNFFMMLKIKLLDCCHDNIISYFGLRFDLNRCCNRSELIGPSSWGFREVTRSEHLSWDFSFLLILSFVRLYYKITVFLFNKVMYYMLCFFYLILKRYSRIRQFVSFWCESGCGFFARGIADDYFNILWLAALTQLTLKTIFLP